MPRRSADQPKSAGQVNLYWRRRVIALVAGLGMLALVAWTVNGALGGGGAKQVTDLSQTASQHPSAPASGSARATPAAAVGSASRVAKPAPSPSSSATPGTSGKHGAAATGHPAGRRGRKTAAAPGPCPGSDLVLSLFSARYSYPAHTRPQFSVNVVSTAPGRCTANLGPAQLHLVIRAGQSQVWDSAGCARPTAQATTLARGVPAAVQITWNGRTSLPGCRPVHRAARPGTYSATAYTGKLSSRTVIFVLKGRRR